MADEGEWYWCLEHKRAEQGQSCPAESRMGPYPSEEAARNWRETVSKRNERWDEEDADWKR